MALQTSGPISLSDIANQFGSQVLVLSVDARRANSTYEVTTHGGRESAGIDALEWIKQATDLGVGEILLNSMDAETMTSKLVNNKVWKTFLTRFDYFWFHRTP